METGQVRSSRENTRFQEGEKGRLIRVLQYFSNSTPICKAHHKPTCPKKAPFKNADDIPLLKGPTGSSC